METPRRGLSCFSEVRGHKTYYLQRTPGPTTDVFPLRPSFCGFGRQNIRAVSEDTEALVPKPPGGRAARDRRPAFSSTISQSSRTPTAGHGTENAHHFLLTAEILHPQVLWASLLAGERVVQHNFCLCFNSFIKLSHCHVAEPLHVLAHFVVRFQLEATLQLKTKGCISATWARAAFPSVLKLSFRVEPNYM